MVEYLAVIIILLPAVCLLTFVLLIDHMHQEDVRHRKQERLFKEHLEMQEDFIDAYKSMLNAAHSADMQSSQPWNNWRR